MSNNLIPVLFSIIITLLTIAVSFGVATDLMVWSAKTKVGSDMPEFEVTTEGSLNVQQVIRNGGIK